MLLIYYYFLSVIMNGSPVNVSPTGMMGFGPHFLCGDSHRLVASVHLRKSDECRESRSEVMLALCPDAVSFSLFGSHASADGTSLSLLEARSRKAVRGNKENVATDAGKYALLNYQSCKDNFFSMAIFNCRTWSARWAVRRTEVSEAVSHAILLSRDVVCGIMVDTASAQRGGRIFRAVPDVSKAARKGSAVSRVPSVRSSSFVANPSFLSADVMRTRRAVAIVGWSATRVFVLTHDAMLYLLNVNARHDSIAAAEPFVAAHAPLDLKVAEPRVTELLSTGQVAMRALTESKNGRYLILYSHRSTSYVVVDVRNICSGASGAPVSAVPSRHVDTDAPVESILPIDAAHLVVSVHNKSADDGDRYIVQIVRLTSTAEDNSIHEEILVAHTSPFPALAVQRSAAKQAYQLVSTAAKHDSTSLCTTPHPSMLVCSNLLSHRSSVERTVRPLRWHHILTSPPSMYDRADTDVHQSTACARSMDEKQQKSQQGPEQHSHNDRDATWTHTADDTLITLHYVLAAQRPDVMAAVAELNGSQGELTKPSSRMMDLAIFAVCTSPYIHSKLAKQWHNGSQGLNTVLLSTARGSVDALQGASDAGRGGGSCGAAAAKNIYTLSWNSHHLRRALRLMKQGDLAHAMSVAAAVLRQATVSPTHACATTTNANDSQSDCHAADSLHDAQLLRRQMKEGCTDQANTLFCDVATATVDVAVQIITVASQVGAQLSAVDVEEVAVLLRASRKCGHALLQHVSRMQMLTENYIQQQVLRRLTGQSRSRANEADGYAVPHVHAGANHDDVNMESIITSWHQEEHQLHTRYTANTWAMHSYNERERYNATIAGASKYLDTVQLELQKANSATASRAAGASTVSVLSDWELVGARPCLDAVMNEFESTLVPHMHK